MRNQQLILLSQRYIDVTTSKVFEAVTRALEIRFIRPFDPLEPAESTEDKYEEDEGDDVNQKVHLDRYLVVSTEDIMEQIDPGLDLTRGLSNASEPEPMEVSSAEDNSDAVVVANNRKRKQVPSLPSHYKNLQKHLAILAADPRRFLEKLPNGSYSIDYPSLTRSLVQESIYSTAAASHGTLAVRLLRILHAQYSTEEKDLCRAAMEKPKLVRAAMSTLQSAGLVETQEIPRDTNRSTTRLVWLWSYSPPKARQAILNDCYRTMARLLKRKQVEQEKVSSIIEKLERVADPDEVRNVSYGVIRDNDIAAATKDAHLTSLEQEAWLNWKVLEQKITVTLARIDDVVAAMRDFSPIGDPFVGNRERPIGFRAFS
jgi:DNA-directed RNA polymerase III subunit RPC3